MRATFVLLPVVMFSGAALLADAADDEAAQATLKKSACLTCHSVDKQKDAPSFKSVAAKYKGKPDAEAKVVTHITTGPKVKLDGAEIEHPKVKGNEADAKNTAAWILSR